MPSQLSYKVLPNIKEKLQLVSQDRFLYNECTLSESVADQD